MDQDEYVVVYCLYPGKTFYITLASKSYTIVYDARDNEFVDQLESIRLALWARYPNDRDIIENGMIKDKCPEPMDDYYEPMDGEWYVHITNPKDPGDVICYRQ